MDELIREYAEILRNAKVGDFTYEGILAESKSIIHNSFIECSHNESIH
jgi:hypothetical protein